MKSETLAEPKNGCACASVQNAVKTLKSEYYQLLI